MSGPLLTRHGNPEWTAAPARMLHVGLGSFFRAHQAWYTDRASDRHEWGIAAFSGRSADLAARLAAQDGLYTLTTRHADHDETAVVASVVAAHAGSDLGAWRRCWSSPSVEVVTLTVTEAAYRQGPQAVAPRLIDGLAARHDINAAPLTIVPCDNVPDNGPVLHAELLRVAEGRDSRLAAWIAEAVTVLTTVVDRITPRPDHHVPPSAGSRWVDAAPVQTEPFSEWVIAGRFAARHPDWESAGARFCEDATPFAKRKLRLLNGAHCLLAHLGILRGHRTVADAVADDELVEDLTQWWQEASTTIDLPSADLQDYVRQLLFRFANPRLPHPLVEIAVDGSHKVPLRILPVLHERRGAGTPTTSAVLQLAAWVAYVRAAGDALRDSHAADIRANASGDLAHATPRLLALLDPDLADDRRLCADVADRAAPLSRQVV